jgi:hypothetical protein
MPYTVAGYCGSNGVQLLLKGSRLALEKQDLSETVIPGVNFGLASLYNVNLTEANLTDAFFAKALGTVYSVAFNPDGKYLVTGDSDGRVQIWNAVTGREILALLGHSDWVYSVAWSGFKLYAGLKIQGVKGLSRAEILTLKALGAVE